MKKITKLTLSVFLSALLAFALFPNGYHAADAEQAGVSISQFDHEDIDLLPHNGDGFVLDERFLTGDYTIIELTFDELQLIQAATMGANHGEIVGGTIVIPGNYSYEEQLSLRRYFVDSVTRVNPVPAFEMPVNRVEEIEPFIIGAHLRNAVSHGDNWFFSSRSLAHAIGARGITLSINQSVSVAHTINSTVSVSAGVVTAGIGASVSGSVSVSVGGSWTVPNTYNNGRLDAFALHDRWTFEVWNNPLIGNPSLQGTGSAYRVNGGVFFQRTRLN